MSSPRFLMDVCLITGICERNRLFLSSISSQSRKTKIVTDEMNSVLNLLLLDIQIHLASTY